MNVICENCGTTHEVVCQHCGASVSPPPEEFIRPLDAAYYSDVMRQIVFIDHAIFDKVMPYIRASTAKVLLFLIANTKGGSNTAFERGFTYPELMAATGIKSKGTMHICLAELMDGLPATKRRPAIQGWDLVVHVNEHKKSKHYYGNRYKLNTERRLEGEAYPLFYAGRQGCYVEMHPWIINTLFPTLTPDQAVIFSFIYRLTIGFGKQKDSVTFNYFTGQRRKVEGEEVAEPRHLSGLRSYQGVKNVLKQLVDLGLITDETPEDPRFGHIYGLNNELSITDEYRAKMNQYRAKVNQVARENESVARENESSSALNDTTKHPLNYMLQQNETGSLNHDPQNGSLGLHEMAAPLPKTTDGVEKSTVSEKPLANLSRQDRKEYLRLLGMKSAKSIEKALDNLDQGLKTDADIEKAVKHKLQFPDATGGLYADFFGLTMKNGNLVVPDLYMWKPNQTTSQPTQSDAAPKSAPHPQNGRATAPPRSPCLDIWNKTLGSLGRQFTQATFFTHFQKAEFRGVNGKEFVVAVAPGSVDWLNNRLNDTIHRTLRYEGQDPELTITFIPLEVKGVVFDGKGFVAR